MSCEGEKRDPLRDTVTSALLSPLAGGKIAHVTCVLGLAYLGYREGGVSGGSPRGV